MKATEHTQDVGARACWGHRGRWGPAGRESAAHLSACDAMRLSTRSSTSGLVAGFPGPEVVLSEASADVAVAVTAPVNRRRASATRIMLVRSASIALKAVAWMMLAEAIRG